MRKSRKRLKLCLLSASLILASIFSCFHYLRVMLLPSTMANDYLSRKVTKMVNETGAIHHGWLCFRYMILILAIRVSMHCVHSIYITRLPFSVKTNKWFVEESISLHYVFPSAWVVLATRSAQVSRWNRWKFWPSGTFHHFYIQSRFIIQQILLEFGFIEIVSNI